MDDILSKIKQANLVGRGGACFSTATKWEMVKNAPSDKKYVVCNASEGEPGVKKDGYILEHYPERVIDGMAVRVPTPVGSLCDIVFIPNKKVDEKMVNQAFKQAARSARFKGILEATEEPIVSTDIVGNPASAIIDLSLTKVIDGDLVKVIAWYDNEWGYSNRLVDLCEYIGKKKLI